MDPGGEADVVHVGEGRRACAWLDDYEYRIASYAANGFHGVHLEGEPSCNNAACQPDQGFSTVTDNVIVDSGKGGILVDKGVHNYLITRNRIGVTANGTAAGNKAFGVNVQAGSRHHHRRAWQ